MTAFLQGLLGIVIPTFAISSMASVGLGHDLREVTRPLRRPALVAAALLANFVAVPLLCVLLLRVFAVDRPHAIGLFLAASAAGSPFLLALTRAAGADPALAGGLLLLLLPCTLLYMPLVVPLAFPQADVNVGAIARTLTATMLLPLALGVVARWRFRRLAPRLVPVLGQISKVSLVLLVAATVLANLGDIRALLRTTALPAAALLVLGAVIAGYLLGAIATGYLRGIPPMRSRVVLALGTGQRNLAAAMIVATSGFDAPEPLVMVVVISLVGFAVLFPAAWVFRRRIERRAEARRVGFGAPEAGAGDRPRA